MRIKINNFQRKLFKSKGNQSRETETNANMPLKSPVHKIIWRLENWRESDYVFCVEMYFGRLTAFQRLEDWKTGDYRNVFREIGESVTLSKCIPGDWRTGERVFISKCILYRNVFREIDCIPGD